MTIKRKSPRIRTKTTHSIVNGMLGDKPITPEELKKIKRGGLGKDEYEGEGLPEKVLKEGEHRFFDFTFDMRFSHDKEGTIEVSFAGKNSGKHTKKVYEGLSEKQSCNAKAIFERNIRGFISNACYALALACIEKQSEDLTKRREFVKNISVHTSKSYREILALGHEKLLEVIQENGIKIEKLEFIDVGRSIGTKKPRKLSEKEIENQKTRKRKILEAMREATNSENKSELAHIIGISRPTLRNWLKSVGAENNRNFYDLIRLAESGK